jgi:hypothetical protein
MSGPQANVYQLKVPQTNEVCEVLRKGLEKHFKQVACDIVDCPDLTKPPFKLAAPGICGNCYLADVGGFDYLLPSPKLDRKYDLRNVLEKCKLPNGFIIGAGAGPHHEVGMNCEMVANLSKTSNGTYFPKVVSNKPRVKGQPPPPHELLPAKVSAFSLLGQFHVSSGLPGKVIHVKAHQRTQKPDSVDAAEKTAFSSLLQAALSQRYSSEGLPVGLGGVFVIRGAKAKLHVMPDFSKEPLRSPAEVNDWLCYYDVDEPVVCVGEMVSHDPKKWGLRNQHFHGFNDRRNAGGHYHYDVEQPGSSVQYDGYFVLAEHLLRLDQPH